MLIVRGASGVVEEIERELNLAKQLAEKGKNRSTRLNASGQVQMALMLIATFKNATVLNEEEYDAWQARLEAKRVEQQQAGG
jgi:hypothetical protein